MTKEEEAGKLARFLKEEGLKCPECQGSTKSGANGKPRQRSNMKVIHTMACQRCGMVWDEVYTLTGYTHIHSGTTQELPPLSLNELKTDVFGTKEDCNVESIQEEKARA